MRFDPELTGYALASIGLLALSSFLTRAGYFLWGDHFPLTDRVRRALRYAPTAALTAIVVPELLPWGQGASALWDLKMLSALVAVIVFWRTRSTVMVIVSGMVAYWILDAFF